MDIKIAKRMDMMDSSGMRKVFDLAAKMENPINLSVGQPDFDTPEEIKESAIEAIKANNNKYTLTQGIPELNERLMKKYHVLYHKNKPESIMITSGVSGAILLALMALVDPGDEVLIPDPYFAINKQMINLLGGKPVYYDIYPDFKITEESIRSKISDKTKIIMINSPNNPTGVVHSREEIETVYKIARETDILIISDEIYDDFVFDDKYTSILDFTNQALVLKGFSKKISVTGWRMGYAMGPAKIINKMIELQQYTFVCAPTPFQYAMIKHLDYNLTHVIDQYREKRDYIYDLLKDNFKVVKPGGAFYLFPEAPGRLASEFVEKAMTNNVIIIPGNVFSERNTHFRVSFATSFENLEKGAKVLCSLV